MNHTLLSYGFHFITINFDKYHYTDNRAGCERHYIAYMEKGHSKIVSENITLEINPGDVFYIPKGLSYQSYWTSETEIRFKSFGFDLFPEAGEKNFLLQKITCTEEVAEQVKNITTNIPVTSRILADFYEVLTKLLSVMQYDPFSNQKMILEKAKRYIYKNPDCRMSDIAKLCLISESALYEIFKKEEGITPNTLRQKTLCEKAVFLLSTTDKSVQEISDALGFSSTSYFRKQLHKHIGKTPREIRKSGSSL